MKSHSDSYKEAGVDVTAGYRAVELMKKHVARTKVPGVISSLGGFGGLFELDFQDMDRPVLVSGTDGVGTKLRIAFLMDKHDTVGIDCVAMCVNDVICSGAKPLFFLDYIALGRNVPEKVASIVSGIAEGCVQANCALVGGETAEMPGFYPPEEYDLAGFSVGLVDRTKILTGDDIRVGDAIIGLESSGIHSNGYSLVRRIYHVNHTNINMHVNDFGKTLGEELLTPTKIYVNPIQTLLQHVHVKAISHITGGGFYENIPRMLGEGRQAMIEREKLPKMPVFEMLEKLGHIPERDMFNTFNMGIGMAVVVPADEADQAVRILRASGEKAHIIGAVNVGDEGVIIC